MLERKIKAGRSDIRCPRPGKEGNKVSHHHILKLGIWRSAHILLTHIFFFTWNVIATAGSWSTTLNHWNGETSVEQPERNKLLWSPLVLAVLSPHLSCPTPHNTDSVLMRENNTSCSSSLHCQYWKKGRTKNRHWWNDDTRAAAVTGTEKKWMASKMLSREVTGRAKKLGHVAECSQS